MKAAVEQPVQVLAGNLEASAPDSCSPTATCLSVAAAASALLMATLAGMLVVGTLAAAFAGTCLCAVLGVPLEAAASVRTGLRVHSFVRLGMLVITHPIGTGVERLRRACVAGRCVSSPRDGTSAP